MINYTDAMYAVAVPDKAVRQWIVEYVFMIINELGYEGVNIAMKNDGAPELKELRRLVSAKRSQPTVHDSPVDGLVGWLVALTNPD